MFDNVNLKSGLVWCISQVVGSLTFRRLIFWLKINTKYNEMKKEKHADFWPHIFIRKIIKINN